MVEKDWTIKQAQAAQDEVSAARTTSEILPTDPLVQWAVLQDMEIEHQRYIAGDKAALFHAIHSCANHGLVLPDWIASAFNTGYQEVVSFNVSSWDEAYGRPYPKNFKLKDAKSRRYKGPKILLDIANAVLTEGFSIGPELWNIVADRNGVGERFVRELWYEKNGLASMQRERVKIAKERWKKDSFEMPKRKNSS